MMRTRTSMALRVLGIAAVLGSALALGCATGSTGSSEPTVSRTDVAPLPDPAVKSDGTLTGGAVSGAEVGGAPQALDAAETPALASQDTLVISAAGMDVEVKNLDAAVSAVRALATKNGATISSLSTSAGSDPFPTPQPLDGSTAAQTAVTPGGASITLRVPAEKLSAAQRDIAALGRVISQTSSQDDVTQQHVDMKARLKNLQAEESRLRTFFLKAKRVSEMLSIEQELSRVRGEIESMQAQITYLERQAAMATLTVSLSQPGALVSPAAGGWGFSAAIRDGIRAAASVTRGLITTLLAFSPVMVLGLVLFVVIRAMVARRRRNRAATTVSGPSQAPTDPEAPSRD